MNTDYYEQILAVNHHLYQIHETVFESIANIALKGEMKDWVDADNDSQIFILRKEIFAQCKDSNIKILVKLLHNIEDALLSIYRLNNSNSAVEKCG